LFSLQTFSSLAFAKFASLESRGAMTYKRLLAIEIGCIHSFCRWFSNSL